MIRHRRHRSVAMGVGALVLACALLISPALSAAPAQAASGSEECQPAKPAPSAQPAANTPAKPEAPEQPVPATLVTPEAPRLSEVDCGTAPEVIVPTVAGVIYERTAQGDRVTITATPERGYAFPSGAATSWTLTVAATPCACTPTPIDWEDSEAFDLSFTVTQLNDGNSRWTIAGVPSGWAQSGAVFNFEYSDMFYEQLKWEVPFGTPFPDGLTAAWTSFIHTERTSGNGTYAGGLLHGDFKLEDPRIDVKRQEVEALEMNKVKYERDDLSFWTGTRTAQQVLDLSVTAPVNSCGALETRQYRYAAGYSLT
ncbi:hypothetical protein JD292_03640 [Leucobacter sp. CSA2]|uniref:Uncharacterized protein n=1 Tax=Leucobacter edaphi TaxID=2796472 RepID=A0A934UW14_9MICO|nr:hypothetical protein [Leucobacter edaphi]MBK0421174.1 hypothetical protein [Leucobacter edaphi]